MLEKTLDYLINTVKLKVYIVLGIGKTPVSITIAPNIDSLSIISEVVNNYLTGKTYR